MRVKKIKKDDIIIMRPIRCDINGQPEENSVKITWVNIIIEGVQDEKR